MPDGIDVLDILSAHRPFSFPFVPVPVNPRRVDLAGSTNAQTLQGSTNEQALAGSSNTDALKAGI